jgi:hypothetical protein
MARLLLMGLLAALLLLGAAACSEDDKDDARETATSLGEELDDRAGQAGARAQAETLRGLIKEDDRTPSDGARSMAVLEESASELPGEPEVVGVADGDGDGLDDDGRVEIVVNDESACLTIADSEPGTDPEIEVAGGACG